MKPEAYWYLLAASMAGGFSGILVMWNRKRSPTAGASTLRRLAALALGTASSACALWAFGKAFGAHSSAYAAMVMIVVTGWVAVLQSVAPPRVPPSLLKVRTEEFDLLQAPWTGVRWFGAVLRRTPLRHLGGRVYLSEAGRDPLAVLRGIHEAEAVHIGALLFSCPWLVMWGMQGRWRSIVCGLAIHVPLNVYPILHLRHVTWRMERYMARTRRNQGA